MADINTSCGACGAAFETKRGLAVHRTRSGHGGDQTYSASSARPIPCVFPGCSAGFRSRLGLRIHSTLMGHQPPADQFARGDGPPPTPRVRSTVNVGIRNASSTPPETTAPETASPEPDNATLTTPRAALTIGTFVVDEFGNLTTSGTINGHHLAPPERLAP